MNLHLILKAIKLFIMKSLLEKVFFLFTGSRSRFFKILFFIVSACTVIYAVTLLFSSSAGFFRTASAAAFFLLKIVSGFCISLVLKTLPYLLPPALLYFTACLFLKRKYLRYYVFLIVFSVYIIWFIKFTLNTEFFFIGHVLKLPEILITLVQIYIFTALIIPDCMVNILGSIFFIFKSIFVFILPDLPFRFDDFGMILALFIFTFLYLNTIVFLIKQVGNIIIKINPEKLRIRYDGRNKNEQGQ